MNAIAPQAQFDRAKAAERVARLGETPQETALRRSISVHCPNQDAMTMAARVWIAKNRDRAGAGLARASAASAPLLAHAASVAATWVYAPADFRQLQSIAAAVAMTIEAAVAMERALADGR